MSVSSIDEANSLIAGYEEEIARGEAEAQQAQAATTAQPANNSGNNGGCLLYTSMLEPAADQASPEGLGEVLTTLLMNVVANPVGALMNANYLGILAWRWV